MGINVEVMDGFPQVDFARERPTGKYQVKIDYNDLVPFIAELFPVILYGGRDYLGSAPMPGFPWLKCERVQVKPFGKMAGTFETPPIYPHWLVDINYSSLYRDGQMGRGTRLDRSGPGGSQGSDNGAGGGQLFLKHDVQISGEFLSLPEAALRWQLDVNGNAVADDTAQSVKVNDNVRAGLVVPTISHKLTWSYVNFPPWTAIRNCLGCVNQNSGINQGMFMGAFPETLLFLGAEAHRDYNTTGQSYWSVSYSLTEKVYNFATATTSSAQGWNHFLRPETGKFERVWRKDGNQTPIYRLQDFSTLFVQGV